MPEITIADDLTLHYEFAGDPSGPLLVFVNGLLTDRGSWQAHLPYFADYSCLTWDCRGQGRSSQPDQPSYPVAAHAQDLAALLDALAPAEPAAIVGLSNGAAAALHFASEQPERVRALVISGAYARVDAALRLKLDSWIAAMRAGGPGLRFDVATPWVWGPRFLAAHADALAGFRERGLALDTRAAERLIAGAMIHELADDRLARISAPTLVCVGEDDVLTPPALARAIVDALPAAQLETLPELGHAAALEDVEGFCRRTRRWFDAHLPTRR